MRDDWQRQGDIPLEVVEAPFRDLGDPLRAYLRELTGTDDRRVVIMPELVVRAGAGCCTTSARST